MGFQVFKHIAFKSQGLIAFLRKIQHQLQFQKTK